MSLAPLGASPEARTIHHRKAAGRLATAARGRATALGLLALLASLAVPTAALAQGYFGKNKVQYESREWFTLRQPHVEILFYPEEEALAREVAAIAESTCAEYDTLFRMKLDKPIPILLFSSHQAFQQSNAAIGFIGEGTGGLTELVKGRVLIPHTGSRRQLVWVTRHELVHAYMLEKLAQVQRRHNRYRSSMPPLWFVEGLAEYLSTTWDSQAEGLMQDAVLSEKAYPVRDSWPIYGTVQMYKEGQSFLEFLGRNYSKRHVMDVLENWWQRPTFAEVFELVFDRSLESLDDQWFAELKRHYFPRVAQRKWAGESARRLTRGDSYNLAPAAMPARSDSALRFCYLSADHAGYALKQVVVPKGGRPHEERVLSGGFSAKFESFHLFRSRIGVSPRGHVALVSQKEGRDVIHVVDPPTKQLLGTLELPGTISLASPAWLGDSVLIVSGQRPDGQSDLFRVRLADGSTYGLTDDPAEDDDPTVHPDGKRIVFSSDRRGGAAGLRHLFEMNLETGDVRPLTSGSFNEREPAWSPDGTTLAFRSDRGGIDDLYVWRDGRVRRLTRLIGPVLTPAWSADGRSILFTAESKLSFHIYRVPVDEQTLDPEKPEKLAREPLEPTAHLPSHEDLLAAAVDVPGLPGMDMTAIDSTQLHGVAIDRWVPEPVNSDLRDWPHTPRIEAAAVPYRRRLSLDIAQNGVAFDPAMGSSGAAQFALSDLTGDERISFFIANNAQDVKSFLTGFELGVTYFNQRQRLNWGAGVFRLDQIYDPDFNQVRSERRIGGLLTASYPFSKFSRLQGTLVLRHAQDHYIREQGGFQDLWLASNFLSFVRDNSRWSWMGPAGGTRWNLTGGFTRDLSAGTGDFFTLSSDFRNYVEPMRNIVSATRVLAQNSFGDNAQLFYLGGRQSLRGYPYRSFRGNHSLLVQQELRFPLLHNVTLGVPVSWTLPPISGALFADIATMGDPGEEFETRASYGASVYLTSYFLPPIRVNFIKRHDFQRAEKGMITEFVLGYSF